MNIGPLLIKSFFPPSGEEEGGSSLESMAESGGVEAGGGVDPQAEKEAEKARKKEEMKKKIGAVKDKIGGFFSKIGKGLKDIGKKVIEKHPAVVATKAVKNAVADKVKSVSSKASYEQGGGEGSGGFIPLPLTEDGGGMVASTSSSGGGGGGGSSEDPNDPLLLLYMGK